MSGSWVFRAGVIATILVCSVGNAVDCGKEAEEQVPAMTKGEWILRCRYRDAQPQYLRNSLIRMLSAFSPDPLPENGFAKSLDYLENAEARDAIFQAYGLYFDVKKKERLMPGGFNSTLATSAPVMVSDEGKVMLSRYVLARKTRASLSVNCLVCHSSIVPTAVDGVPAVSFGTPNVFVDLQKIHGAFQKDLRTYEQTSYPGSGSPGHAVERNPAGNSFVNSADYYGVLAGLVRDPFPGVKPVRLLEFFFASPTVSEEVASLSEIAQAQPYLKTQSWANYRYKKPLEKLYVDGGFSGNSAAVTYRLAFSIDPSGDDYVKYAEEFEQHVPQFLSQVEPPAYPFPVHQDRAKQGHVVYENRCAHCHGGFQKENGKWTLDYPGEVVENIGTDDQRFKFFTEILPASKEWGTMRGNGVGAKIVYNKGYIAPPLVGIWARAPYLHNGSVPTLRQLFGKTSARFSKFGIWPQPADHRYYDQVNVGWKTIDLSSVSAPELVQLKASAKENEFLRVYDPEVRFSIFDRRAVPGLKNIGHDLGGAPFDGYLPPADLDNLIEFLKTI